MMRNWLHVVRVYASTIPASMIEFQPVRDGAIDHLPKENVNGYRSPLPQFGDALRLKIGVPIRIQRAFPEPATIRLFDLAPDADFGWLESVVSVDEPIGDRLAAAAFTEVRFD